MNDFLFKIMIVCYRLVKGVANRILNKKYIRPRNFSNAMLRRYTPYFGGRVLNVSGWKDEDGEGCFYKSYFKNATNYSISNVKGHKKGLGSTNARYKEIELDLLLEIPTDLKNAFDVVFSHTTLEHIYNFQLAFKHLCELSRDIVIVVVPVMQQIHPNVDFGDYWRPTTMALTKLFLNNSLKPLVIKCNDQPFAPIYCFAIGTKNSGKYKDKFPSSINFQMGAYNYGSSLRGGDVYKLLNNNQ